MEGGGSLIKGTKVGCHCSFLFFLKIFQHSFFSFQFSVNISPPSRNGCARLAEDTEIHVQPYSGHIKENTERTEQRVVGDCSMSGLSSTFSRFLSRFASFGDTNDHSMVDDCIKNLSRGTGDVNLRIAPRSLIDDDICSNMHPTAIIALNDGTHYYIFS